MSTYETKIPILIETEGHREIIEVDQKQEKKVRSFILGLRKEKVKKEKGEKIIKTKYCKNCNSKLTKETIGIYETRQ